MKNVAKCDTWCELQNPVNHRVFERKLRPKPFGRGHVCLGVTHRRPHSSPVFSGCWRCGAENGLPYARRAVGPKLSPRLRLPRHSVVVDYSVSRRARGRRNSQKRPWWPVGGPPLMRPSKRPQVRRGYPLSLSISISGGKETYEDSLSNGERTGNSPG